jgi:WD40 repeat protein
MGNNLLASGSIDQTIKIWDITYPILVRTLTGHTSYVKCLEKIDDTLLASGSYDTKIKLWNITSGVNYLTLSGHGNYIESLKYLDNDLLASNSLDLTVRIWSTKNGTLFKTLNGYSNYPFSLEKINSNLLVSGTLPIYTYDFKKLAPTTCTLSGHSNYVFTIKLIDEVNNIIASGACDYTIKMWDMDSCHLVKTLSPPHSSYVSGIELIDNSTFASVSYDKTVKLWNLTGSLMDSFIGHTSYIYAIVKVDDGLIEGINI